VASASSACSTIKRTDWRTSALKSSDPPTFVKILFNALRVCSLAGTFAIGMLLFG
jgi:hypothetical protein